MPGTKTHVFPGCSSTVARLHWRIQRLFQGCNSSTAPLASKAKRKSSCSNRSLGRVRTVRSERSQQQRRNPLKEEQASKLQTVDIAVKSVVHMEVVEESAKSFSRQRFTWVFVIGIASQ